MLNLKQQKWTISTRKKSQNRHWHKW